MQPDLESVIKLTLTGEIDDKIENLTQKYKQPFPDEFYYRSKGRDPTAFTAIAMADVKLGQRDMIQAYKRCRATIKACLSSLDDDDIHNIKRYLEVAGEPIEGYQRYKARDHFKEIESEIDQPSS